MSQSRACVRERRSEFPSVADRNAPVVRIGPSERDTAVDFIKRSSRTLNTSGDPRVLTIPSSDLGFRRHVDRLQAAGLLITPEALEARLRRMFPRAVVRRRDISGEPVAWYVYRDGGWRSELTAAWWEEPGLPRVVVSREGWIVEAGPTALGLFGFDASELGTRHFTDFVVPGNLEDSVALFAIVDEGGELSATIRMRPASGDDIAVDIHVRRDGDSVVGVMRLADDVEIDRSAPAAAVPVVRSVPATDAAFRGYVGLAVGRMSEPTPDGLALRLRRLYPHARVVLDGDVWIAQRDEFDSYTEVDGDGF